MENSVSGILGNAMESIMKTMGDNCTIGTPIEMKNGTIILPVSKISVGFAGGGTDFGKNEAAKKNFGGGGGTGITATPVGFLVVTQEGKISFTSVEVSTSDSLSVDTLIDNVTEIVDKIKDKFGKKGDSKKADKNEKTKVEETKVEEENETENHE